MRVFLTVLVLIFSLQSWTKADDIRDFQIEEMSIGDSLLDYFTEQQIKTETRKLLYDGFDKKFLAINIESTSGVYDGLQIHYKNNDKKFTIYSIDGIFAFDQSIIICNDQKTEILNSISNTFSNLQIKEGKNLEMASGRGVMDSTKFMFKNGDFIEVACYNYRVPDYYNHGRLGVVRKELDEWIVSLK